MGSSGSSGGSERIITDDMIAEAEIGAKEWNRYVTDHLPMEQKYIADKTGKPVGELAGTMRGQVNADLAQATKAMSGPQAGVDPSRSVVQRQQGGVDVTGAATKALTDVTAKAGERKVTDLSTLVAMGRGQAVEAQQGVSEMAATSAEAALTKAKADQQERFANQQATAGLVNSAAKTGLTLGMSAMSAPAAPELSTTGNTYAYNAGTGTFDVAAKPAAVTPSLMSGMRLSY